jgi:hypothetical protein
MYWLSILMLAQSFPLETMENLKEHKTAIAPVMYRGLKSIQVTEPPTAVAGEDRLVLLTKSKFHNGSIELELAGAPGAAAGGGARGFVGLAFRVAEDISRFEAFYLRPTNGRAEDQVRRNHSSQYISFSNFPWEKLRKEFPEKYESYVDLEPGAWTRVRIEVEGDKAKLFVHGNSQPTLVVNDLKHGDTTGALALWIGPGTVAHFRNLRVSARD